jgi:hypothetical protein
MVEVKVAHTAIERPLEERIMTSRPPRPDPIRSRPENDARSPARQHDLPAGSPRRSARIRRMNPATSIGSASPSNRLGCGTRIPMSTLPAITYVVQARSNTVGVLSTGTGREEGLVRLAEPGRTIEDHPPRVLPSLRGLSGNRGAGDHVSAVLSPERRIDVVQDVHGLHVGGRSLPRFAS